MNHSCGSKKKDRHFLYDHGRDAVALASAKVDTKLWHDRLEKEIKLLCSNSKLPVRWSPLANVSTLFSENKNA